MRVWSLSSGSSGNCYLVREGDCYLLLEAGISITKIERELALLGLKASQLSGIVVSHEHTDHWLSAVSLSRRLKIPLACSQGTLVAGSSRATPFEYLRLSGGGQITLGGISIEAFSLPHDARESIGFFVQSASGSLCLATDMGVATEEVIERARASDLVILEANHDTEMLVQGPYPQHLKARILGARGHLSNEAAGHALIRIAEGRPRDAWLAHLSHTNNSPRKALSSVEKTLRREGVGGLRLSVALRDRRSLHWDSEFATLEQLPLF